MASGPRDGWVEHRLREQRWRQASSMVLWGRIPVARCEYQLLCVALVGLKPTDGRVRRHGFTPLSWSLVHVRALTRTVRDTALLLSIISGYDPHDPATSWLPVPDYVASLTGNVAGPRVGIPRAFFFKGLDADVQQALEQAIQHLKALGVQISGVSWSSIGRVPGLDAISWAEGAAAHEQWIHTWAEYYGADVRERMQRGLSVPSDPGSQA